MNMFIIAATVYGSLVNGNIIKAPYSSRIDVGNGIGITMVTASMTEAQANKAGYKLMVDERPETDDKHYSVSTGWEEKNNRIVRVYEVKEIPPPPPRRFYKYDISTACLESGFLDQMIEYFNANPKVKWFWDAADAIVETDPYFISVTNTVISSGMATDEKVRKILDRAYELGKISEGGI